MLQFTVVVLAQDLVRLSRLWSREFAFADLIDCHIEPCAHEIRNADLQALMMAALIRSRGSLP